MVKEVKGKTSFEFRKHSVEDTDGRLRETHEDPQGACMKTSSYNNLSLVMAVDEASLRGVLLSISQRCTWSYQIKVMKTADWILCLIRH